MGYLRSPRRPTLTWSDLTSFVMTYHDHGHPIKTNPYKAAKNEDIGLKLSRYDHMCPLRSHRGPRPTITWSDLTSFVIIYHDHGHPIEINTDKSAKTEDIDPKLSR